METQTPVQVWLSEIQSALDREKGFRKTGKRVSGVKAVVRDIGRPPRNMFVFSSYCRSTHRQVLLPPVARATHVIAPRPTRPES